MNLRKLPQILTILSNKLLQKQTWDMRITGARHHGGPDRTGDSMATCAPSQVGNRNITSRMINVKDLPEPKQQ